MVCLSEFLWYSTCTILYFSSVTGMDEWVGSLVAVVWYILFLSFLSFSFSIVFFVGRNGRILLIIPHTSYASSFLIIALVHLSSAHLARIVPFIWRYSTGLVFLRVLAPLQAPQPFSYFLYFYFFEKAGFKKSIVSSRILRPAGMRQTGRRKVGRY